MNLTEIHQYLNSFTNFETTVPLDPASLDLKRVETVLTHLDSPHRGITFVHVAGTKGKGSTSAFTAAILKEAGYRTGLYTSPHLSDVRERVRVLDKKAPARSGDGIFPDAISVEDMGACLRHIRPALDDARRSPAGALTYFEVLTILALVHFRRQGVDVAVMETGLGGRLDATSVVDAAVCAITPVSLEHMKQLGSTIAAIAAEKAAIIKRERQAVIVAPQDKDAEKVIRERCRQVKAADAWVGKDLRYRPGAVNEEGQVFDLMTPRAEHKALAMKLVGEHQFVNAAAAVGIVEVLGEKGLKVSPEAVRSGLMNVVWPARFEVIGRNPRVILDCAHNPASAEQLAATVRRIFPQENVVLVLGMSADKDRAGICRALNGIASSVVLTRADHPRSFEFHEDNARELFPSKPCAVIPSLTEALQSALSRTGGKGVVLVTGSVFLAGQARNILRSW